MDDLNGKTEKTEKNVSYSSFYANYQTMDDLNGSKEERVQIYMCGRPIFN